MTRDSATKHFHSRRRWINQITHRFIPKQFSLCDIVENSIFMHVTPFSGYDNFTSDLQVYRIVSIKHLDAT